jgi:predicted phage terminase large subunit-like protein
VNAPAVQRPEKSSATAWVPLKGMQERALACGAYELFMGGAAGPGKSQVLLVMPLRWVSNPGFRAALFRNTFRELERTLVEKSFALYKPLGAKYYSSDHVWEFPGGATIEFAYLERDADVHRFQGAELSFAGFDELPHFTEYQYRYIQSRLRSADGLPIRLRATGNPDGPHLEWVRRRFAPWIDGKVPDGEARWFDPEGRMVPKGTPEALSRSYVRGRLSENPYLGADYRARLMALDPVTRAKLLDGDWDACVGEGKLFHRTWWRFLDAVPADVEVTVRAWDLGGTATGDPSRGVLMHRRPEGTVPRWIVSDVVTVKGPPHEVEAAVKATAELDGQDVPVVLPQDPGQSGISQVQGYARLLPGWRVIPRRPIGDKVKRAGGWSSQVGALNAALVRGPWNAEFVAELHAFPDGSHDDQVDASADGFEELVKMPVPDPDDSNSVSRGGRRR